MGRATPTSFSSWLYNFFPSPSQTRGGASWCPPCPFTKELIISSPSQMCFRESCFYKICFYITQVFGISTNTIWVLIFKLQRTSFKMIHTLTTLILCCFLIHVYSSICCATKLQTAHTRTKCTDLQVNNPKNLKSIN